MSNVIPKVFISYAWTSVEYQERVVNFVNRLRDNGVDTLFDVFNLKPGQNKYAFMQQSVNDPSVSSVLVLCNSVYKTKSDHYEGGVGDETQILAPEVYDDVSSTKFIPVLFEKHPEGKDYIPTFLAGRIYFDLSDSATFEKQYDSLLRHLFDKPAYHEHKVGKMPSYLEDERHDYSSLRQLLSDLKVLPSTEKGRIQGIRNRFLEEYLSVMDSFSWSGPEYPNAEWFLSKIDEMIIPRDICIEFIQELIYILPEGIVDFLADLSERMLNSVPYVYNHSISEHLEFHIWELILMSMALLWRNGNAHVMGDFANRTYYLRNGNSYNQSSATSFAELRPTLELIEKEYNVSETRHRIYRSYAAEIVDKHSKPLGISTEELAFIDLLLMQLSKTLRKGKLHGFWFPLMNGYAENLQERYGNLQSMRICVNYLALFHMNNVDDLKQYIVEIREGKLFGQDTFYFEQYLISNYCILETLGTLP